MRTARQTFLFVISAAATAATVALTLSAQKSLALGATDADPEVVANSWQENSQQYASVSLNGKDLLTYRGESQGVSAEQKAEDLAEKIGDLINENKIDPNHLLPAKEGETAVIRADGNTVLKFEVSNASADKPSAIEESFRVANALRGALGAPTLPDSFLKLAANDVVARGNGSGACFSGKASWYGAKFHGRKTSDGHRFNMDGLTAAHRTLPFGTKLLVMNRKTGDSCVVEVNDRGPFVGNRIVDLSRGAARQLNMISSGVAIVDCLVLGN